MASNLLCPGASMPRVPQQIARLAIVFALAIVALVVMRRVLTPKTFGELGHYRAQAIDDIVATPIKYAGRGACNGILPPWPDAAAPAEAS